MGGNFSSTPSCSRPPASTPLRIRPASTGSCPSQRTRANTTTVSNHNPDREPIGDSALSRARLHASAYQEHGQNQRDDHQYVYTHVKEIAVKHFGSQVLRIRGLGPGGENAPG